jgi:hypothetical protein
MNHEIQKLVNPGSGEALDHVLYEISQFVHAFNKLRERNALNVNLEATDKRNEVFLRNVLLENLLLHGRCLVGFLMSSSMPKGSGRKDDMTPMDFKLSNTWESLKKPSWYERVHKELAHLTLSRTHDKFSKKWFCHDVLSYLQPKLCEFLRGAAQKHPDRQVRCNALLEALTEAVRDSRSLVECSDVEPDTGGESFLA